jgi:hypothetical protein
MSTIPVLLLILAQAGPDRVVVTGTVLGDDGRPAAGAEVVLADDAPPVRLAAIDLATGAVPRAAGLLRDGRAGDDGRFQVDLPEADRTLPRLRRSRFLWALGPAGALAMRPIPEGWPLDGEPFRLTLARPESLRLRVLDPGGRPAAGVRLAPARLSGAGLPAELADRFAVETDSRGRATLSVGAAEETEAIRATSGTIGWQQLRMPRPEPDGARTIRLLPVGRVVGRIEAGDPAAVRGLAVRVRTDADPATEVSGIGGFAAVATDDQGRFTIPAIATGSLELSFEHRLDLPWRGGMVGRPQVQPGSTTEVTVTLKRAVRVQGVVQEVPGGRPVAGAGVSITFDSGIPPSWTDAEGRYSGYVAAPGMVHPYVQVPPRGYYNPTT